MVYRGSELELDGFSGEFMSRTAETKALFVFMMPYALLIDN
jgi:hypothetical protein